MSQTDLQVFARFTFQVPTEGVVSYKMDENLPLNSLPLTSPQDLVFTYASAGEKTISLQGSKPVSGTQEQ